ncbi:MAG TPA: UvrD-helicase domain-containing protein [Phycisphaerales bacterium]|nr:UvrD-helicase domain-containing protein [Phycisphaerales bacterium]
MEWFRGVKDRLECALLEGIRSYWESMPFAKIDDLRSSYLDLKNLAHDLDCHYDHPSVGPFYAAIYHLKRSHAAARMFDRLLGTQFRDSKSMGILDVASGTSSTLWGIAIALLHRRATGQSLPRVIVTESDSSIWMLRQSDALWQALLSSFPELSDLIDRRPWLMTSWDRISFDGAFDTRILTASFVIHRTHIADEGRDMLSESLQRVAVRCECEAIVAWQSPKKTPAMVESLSQWCDIKSESFSPSFASEHERATAVQQWLQCTLAGHVDSTVHAGYWTDYSDTYTIAKPRRVHEQLLLIPDVRLRFDKEQQDAIASDKKHLLCVGAAGTGKTLVLARRLAKYIQGEMGSSRRVLVTAFNKAVLDRIRSEFSLAIPSHLQQYLIGKELKPVWFEMGSLSVRGRHLDDLPTSVKLPPLSDITELLEKSPFSSLVRKYGNSFLANEFVQVIYGRAEGQLENYLKPNIRRGRSQGVGLTRSERQLIFQKFVEVCGTFKSPTHPTFQHRRLLFASQPRLNEDDPRLYSDVFVDEAQDLTRADWRMLRRLAKESASWTICWDRAQAVQTGAAFDSPRRAIEKLRSEELTILQSSHRVPARILRFAEQLRSAVSGPEDLAFVRDEACAHARPHMHSLPGSRPIISFDERPKAYNQIVNDLTHFWRAESTYGSVLIAEKCDRDDRDDLENSIRQSQPKCKSIDRSSVFRFKGCEFDVVIWDMFCALPQDEQWTEIAYTLCTRARTRLYIAAGPDIDPRAFSFLVDLQNAGLQDLLVWTPGSWARFMRR